MFFKLADNGNRTSMASRLRQERVRKFAEMIRSAKREVRILDVGGTADFWLRYRDDLPERVSLTLFNLDFSDQPSLPWIRYVSGDVRRMTEFSADQFDVCFSNSLIEHFRTWEDQQRAAQEMRRVARAYFIQTPNFWFPIEPHFLVPGWHYAPLAIRAYLIQKRDLGWMRRQIDPVLARAEVESVRLLTERELMSLFPGCQIYREKVGPLTKSVTAWRSIS